MNFGLWVHITNYLRIPLVPSMACLLVDASSIICLEIMCLTLALSGYQLSGCEAKSFLQV